MQIAYETIQPTSTIDSNSSFSSFSLLYNLHFDWFSLLRIDLVCIVTSFPLLESRSSGLFLAVVVSAGWPPHLFHLSWAIAVTPQVGDSSSGSSGRYGWRLKFVVESPSSLSLFFSLALHCTLFSSLAYQEWVEPSKSTDLR